MGGNKSVMGVTKKPNAPEKILFAIVVNKTVNAWDPKVLFEKFSCGSRARGKSFARRTAAVQKAAILEDTPHHDENVYQPGKGGEEGKEVSGERGMREGGRRSGGRTQEG